MNCILYILGFFIILIVYHFYTTMAIIENMETAGGTGYIKPAPSPKITAAQASSKLTILEEREKKYATQMNILNDMKKKMDSNTQSIAAMQQGIATCEANHESAASK
jgi:hypothetical protein